MARIPGRGWLVDYFAFYHDVIDNPKLATLAPETFRFWVFVLCIGSRQSTRGSLPDVAEIAFRARVPLAEAEGHLNVLLARGLVSRSAGKLSITKWDDYQPKRYNSTERMRRHRAKVKAEQASKLASPPPCDVTVTSPVTSHCDAVTSPVTPNKEREKPPTEASASLASLKKQNPPTSAPPNPPAGDAAADAGKVVDVESAVAYTRAVLGDAAARVVEMADHEFHRHLDGRWDCFEAAVRSALQTTRPIRDVRKYLLSTARQFAHDGIPPEPVAMTPRPRSSARADPPLPLLVIEPEVRAAREHARARRKAEVEAQAQAQAQAMAKEGLTREQW